MNFLKQICRMNLGMALPMICMIACIPGVPLPVQAEEQEQREYYFLEPVIVTAPSKWAEEIQKTPAAVTYFSGEDLEEAGISEAHDIIDFSPNLHSRHNSVHHSLTIRGVDSFYPSLYSPVGFYVDGVSYPIQFMHNPDLFDLESVEVLRGPQGTLYGRNTESGLINIVTKQPGPDFEGVLTGEYGSYNSMETSFALRGPLVEDKVFLSVSAKKQLSDGFIKNEFTDDENAADIDHSNGRVILRVTPTDRWDISLTGDWTETDDGYGTWRYLNGPLKTDPYRINQDEDQYSLQRGSQWSLQGKYLGADFDVTSVTGYVDYEHDVFSDMDFTANTQNRRTGEANYQDIVLSQELRISSPEDSGALSWQAGIYAFTEQLDTYFDYHIVQMGSLANMSIMQPDADISSHGYAGFGQLTYTLVDRLHLTAGLRYDYQKMEGKVTGTYLDMGTFMYERYDSDEKLDFNQWLPKASVSYEITDSAMAYTSVAKGYNTGGFVYVPSANFTGDGFTYDPEYSWNYEVGIKTSWFGNRLKANLTAFYIDMRDKQVSETDQTTLQLITSNAGKAHSMGFELELAARPMPGLDVFGAIGYADAEFDEFTATEHNGVALVETDYSGNDLQFAPKYTYNIGAQYRHSSGYFGRVDLTGRSSVYGDYANTAKADGYKIVNLRAGYRGEQFEAVLWTENLFDEEYLTYITPHAPYVAGIDGKPRTVGLTLKYWI